MLSSETMNVILVRRSLPKLLKENHRVGVDIGPLGLNLVRFQEDGGHQLGHQLEQFVSWEVLECKLPLPGIVRIFLFKYRVTILIL